MGDPVNILRTPAASARGTPALRLENVLVAKDFFTQAAMDGHLEEAETGGVTIGAYLVGRELLTRSDLYEAMYTLSKSISIVTVGDLPYWDLVLNDAGQTFGSGTAHPKGTLLLGTSEDVALETRRVFILTTAAEKTSSRFASVFAKVTAEKYTIRAILIAEDVSILDVVLSEWKMFYGGAAVAKDAEATSEKHEAWDKILQEAHRQRASDVHLFASMGRGEIKFRIHGELEIYPMALTEADAVALAQSMYNTLPDKGSTGDGFNARVPQDAVITRVYPTGTLRLRYSGLPVEPSGVNVTLRLIPVGVTAKPKTAAMLGYSPDQCETLERIFGRSSGMILFLGTTGSGKSTSMANMLMQKVKENPGKLLRTVENPVEIRIPGASQTAVVVAKDSVGNPFLEVFRALMRADPDWLMVGEIRDPDTASLAIQAVRSGHLCVSTLHADGAPIAYDRLAGMGIPRSDIASLGLIAGLIYQRLLPVLCPNCRVPSKTMRGTQYASLFRRLDVYLDGHSDANIYFKNPLGCARCGKRGIVDRTVCAEILVPKPGMLRAIAEGDSGSLWRQWRDTIDTSEPGVMTGRTAFEHALWKMSQGVVSPLDVEKEFRYLDEKVFE